MPAALDRAIEPVGLLICTCPEEEGEEEEQEDDNYNVPAAKKAKLSGNQNN